MASDRVIRNVNFPERLYCEMKAKKGGLVARTHLEGVLERQLPAIKQLLIDAGFAGQKVKKDDNEVVEPEGPRKLVRLPLTSTNDGELDSLSMLLGVDASQLVLAALRREYNLTLSESDHATRERFLSEK